MQAYCYAYYYSMPSSFDFGSAIPCIDLAVQSLTTTYQGDDGKYYQTDIIGDRDGEIRFGGRGVFDGSRAVSFDDLTGVTIANYEGTSTPTISGNTVNFITGYLDYLELSNGSKYYFENFDNETLYDVSDNALHGTLSAGSAIDWQTQEEGIYSYWDNYGGNFVSPNYIPALESNKAVDVFGTALENAGRVKYPNEICSSCLSLSGTQQFQTAGFVNMAEDEDFYYTFKFSLSGTSKRFEALFIVGDSIYLFINRDVGGNPKPNFLILNSNNNFETVVFPNDLPRDGSLITGFIKKMGDQVTICFNGIEETKTLTNPSRAITNGTIEIFGDNLASLSFMDGEAYSLDIYPHFKTDFSEADGVTIYNLYENEDAELVAGSSVGLWELSPYAYPRNNTLGFGRAGDAFIPIELGGSCLVMNGTDNSITINESCGLGYDEDFHYIFGFSLSESTNYHECLFNIQSDTYYGGSMFLYVKYGDIPKFRIRKKVNSSYLDYTLSFPDELPRDGSKISGFVKKEGSIITMGFNGVEVSADFPGEAPAYENDIITIGTSDSGMSSAFLTGKLFYLDIAPIFKSTFSDFSGSTIENMYEDKSAGILSGSSLSAWEISKLAVTYIGTNIGLNGSESEYKDPYVFELIEACNPLAPNFRFSSTESLLWGYDDIEGNVQDLDFMFSDVNTNTPVKDSTTTYSEALTGDCLVDAKEYFHIHEAVTQDGEDVTQGGESVVI